MYLLSRSLFPLFLSIAVTCFALLPAAAADPDPGELKQACDRDDGQSCYRLATLYERGLGVSKDEKLAAELYDRACAEMVGAACHNLAIGYFSGTDSQPKDIEQALAYYRLGCIAGQVGSCFNLARILEQGIGVEKDPAKAASYYEQACSLEAAAACYNRAVFAYDGIGGERNPGAAARYFERACDLGEIQACLSAGLMHVNDQDLPVNAGLGLPLLKRACAGGMADGCHLVTIVYLGGSGIAQDKQAALDYARKGCSLKFEASCSAAKEIEASM